VIVNSAVQKILSDGALVAGIRAKMTLASIDSLKLVSFVCNTRPGLHPILRKNRSQVKKEKTMNKYDKNTTMVGEPSAARL